MQFLYKIHRRNRPDQEFCFLFLFFDFMDFIISALEIAPSSKEFCWNRRKEKVIKQGIALWVVIITFRAIQITVEMFEGVVNF